MYSSGHLALRMDKQGRRIRDEKRAFYHANPCQANLERIWPLGIPSLGGFEIFSVQGLLFF